MSAKMASEEASSYSWFPQQYPLKTLKQSHGKKQALLLPRPVSPWLSFTPVSPHLHHHSGILDESCLPLERSGNANSHTLAQRDPTDKASHGPALPTQSLTHTS